MWDTCIGRAKAAASGPAPVGAVCIIDRLPAPIFPDPILLNPSIPSSEPGPGAPASESRTFALALGAAFVAWLVASSLFLLPVLADPTQAVRGDDYWTMSEWFGHFGPWPHTHFGPGYPLLIFVLRAGGLTMLGLAVLQKLMLVGIAAAIYRIARLYRLPPLVALATAAAFTVFPVIQTYSSLFFAETFFLLLATWGVRHFVGACLQGRSAGPMRLVGAFALLGVAALVRGNALVLLAGCTLIGFVWLPWRGLLLAALVGALPVLGWSTLNWHWYGHFKPTSSGDAAIGASIVGPVMSELEGIPREVGGPEIWIKGRWQDQFPNQFELSIATKAMAIDYARKHPVPVVLGNVKGWFKALLGPGQADLETFFGTVGTWLAALSLTIRAALLVGMLGYFASGTARRTPAFAGCLLAMLVGHVIAGGAAGHSRFGFPVDTFAVIATALWLHAMCRPRPRAAALTPGRAPAPPARR
ncbi:MAG: hypothetical protein AB7P21_28015 [Lautropia sp.]